jgi:hypothetical protein
MSLERRRRMGKAEDAGSHTLDDPTGVGGLVFGRSVCSGGAPVKQQAHVVLRSRFARELEPCGRFG